MQESNNEPKSVRTHLSEPTKQVFMILGIATVLYVALMYSLNKKIKR